MITDLITLDSVIDKYQTGNYDVDCRSLLSRRRMQLKWLNVNRVHGRFVAGAGVVLVRVRIYSLSFCGFFVVATVDIFSSVSNIMLTSLDYIFQQLFRMAVSCMAVRCIHLWIMAIFEHKYFTR